MIKEEEEEEKEEGPSEAEEEAQRLKRAEQLRLHNLQVKQGITAATGKRQPVGGTGTVEPAVGALNSKVVGARKKGPGLKLPIEKLNEPAQPPQQPQPKITPKVTPKATPKTQLNSAIHVNDPVLAKAAANAGKTEMQSKSRGENKASGGGFANHKYYNLTRKKSPPQAPKVYHTLAQHRAMVERGEKVGDGRMKQLNVPALDWGVKKTKADAQTLKARQDLQAQIAEKKAKRMEKQLEKEKKLLEDAEKEKPTVPAGLQEFALRPSVSANGFSLPPPPPEVVKHAAPDVPNPNAAGLAKLNAAKEKKGGFSLFGGRKKK